MICKICIKSTDSEWKAGDNSVLTYKTWSTSVMREHLHCAHDILNEPDVKTSSSPALKQNKIYSVASVQSSNATKPFSPASQKHVTELMVNWIVRDFRPLIIFIAGALSQNIYAEDVTMCHVSLCL